MRLANIKQGQLEAYRVLCKAHVGQDLIGWIRWTTNGNLALGSRRSEKRIAKLLNRRVRPNKARRPARQAVQAGHSRSERFEGSESGSSTVACGDRERMDLRPDWENLSQI